MIFKGDIYIHFCVKFDSHWIILDEIVQRENGKDCLGPPKQVWFIFGWIKGNISDLKPDFSYMDKEVRYSKSLNGKLGGRVLTLDQ